MLKNVVNYEKLRKGFVLFSLKSNKYFMQWLYHVYILLCVLSKYLNKYVFERNFELYAPGQTPLYFSIFALHTA